jgi:hypothetical protein
LLQSKKLRSENGFQFVVGKRFIAIGDTSFLGICFRKYLVPTAHQLLAFWNNPGSLGSSNAEGQTEVEDSMTGFGEV